MIESVDNATFKLFNGIPLMILPLTKTTGKIRLKNRHSFYDYGLPFAPRQTPISFCNYKSKRKYSYF